MHNADIELRTVEFARLRARDRRTRTVINEHVTIPIAALSGDVVRARPDNNHCIRGELAFQICSDVFFRYHF